MTPELLQTSVTEQILREHFYLGLQDLRFAMIYYALVPFLHLSVTLSALSRFWCQLLSQVAGYLNAFEPFLSRTSFPCAGHLCTRIDLTRQFVIYVIWRSIFESSLTSFQQRYIGESRYIFRHHFSSNPMTTFSNILLHLLNSTFSSQI